MHGFTVFSAVSLPLVAAFIVPRVSQPDNWSASLEVLPCLLFMLIYLISSIRNGQPIMLVTYS